MTIFESEQRKQAFDAQFEQWTYAIDAQQLILETIANIATGDELGCASSTTTSSSSSSSSSKDSPISAYIIKFLSHPQLGPKIIAKCEFVNEQQVLQVYLSSSDGTVYAHKAKKAFGVVQSTALTCLANLTIVLEPEQLGEIHDHWKFLCKLCSQSASKRSITTLVPITNAMYMLLRKSIQSSKPLIMSIDQAKSIFGLCQFQVHAQVRMHAVGIVGVLGQMKEYQSIIGEIATQLVKSLADSEPLVVVEALNAIFDCFAEPDMNQVVKKVNMMSALHQLLPKLKAKLHAKSQLEQHQFEQIAEATLNLERFFEYKQNQ
mmetsp:Transcript_3287/g.4831  ORF Transcript_3287/g.4831 Transcript_3287/m.4831 type:complete len:319 (-) Transcript_3287:28-984(-)